MKTLEITKSKAIEQLVQNSIDKEVTEAQQFDLKFKRKAKSIIAEFVKAKLSVREKVNRAAESAKRSNETENQTEQDNMLATKPINKIELEAKSTAKLISPSLYDREISIVTSGSNLNKIKKLERSLGLIQGLEVLLIGGSEEDGTEFIVSTDKPILLINTLKNMLFIDQVIDNGKIIQVTMKT